MAPETLIPTRATIPRMYIRYIRLPWSRTNFCKFTQLTFHFRSCHFFVIFFFFAKHEYSEGASLNERRDGLMGFLFRVRRAN